MKQLIKKYIDDIGFDHIENTQLIQGFLDYILRPQNEKICSSDVIRAVNDYYNIDIKLKCKKRKWSLPRQLCFHILFTYFDYNTLRISVLFDYRETNIRHGIKSATNLLDIDKNYYRDYIKIMEMINRG